MPRITQIRSVEDYPHELPDVERKRLEQAFERYERYMKNTAPGLYESGDDAIAVTNSWGQMLHNPQFALPLLDLSDVVLNDMAWSQRTKLRELAILSIYQHQRCDYGYRAHQAAALHFGVTEDQIAELPVFRTSELFDDEERTVIDFVHAALDGHVSDELFERTKAYYGEREMLELTVVIAYWSFWGIMLNTLQPDYAALH